MIKSMSRILSVCAAACLVSAAQAQVNGLHTDPRVFNDFSTSSLVITNTNTNPGGNVTITDGNWANDGAGGNGANRSDVRASTDGGASDAVFNPTQGYKISTTITLSAGSNSPRKEAGIRFNSQNGGDGLFIVNTDAGEIVAFGAGAPFALFGKNADGNGYVPGTPITFTEEYDPPGLAGPAGAALMQYTVSYATRGINQTISGPFSNLENSIAGTYTFGVYAQGGPNTTPTNDLTDFINASFSDVSISLVPEPASFALLALAGLGMISRRRSLR